MRPRRAAATTTKTYKEPETDDSQSELEVALLVKKIYIFSHFQITRTVFSSSRKDIYRYILYFKKYYWMWHIPQTKT